MDQYERFLMKDNFKLAFLRIKTTRRCEYKEFYYKDIAAFEMFLDANIEQLISDIKQNKYQAQPVCKYYVPKNKNLARPFSLLNFIDLLVYQAICNIIVDNTYDYREGYFNNTIFGNIPIKTDSLNPIFTYTKWKDQWKSFKKAMSKYYENGYIHVVEFDIASFFDTIDHEILFSTLKKRMVDDKIASLLKMCLDTWVISATDKYNFKKGCGIPQGPECSAVLSELFLFEIDEIFKKTFVGKIEYLRYADDIRVMAKNKLDCEKAIVYLDLICRDFSLIPQVSKIETIQLDKTNVNKYINNSDIKFSLIANDFHKQGFLSEKNQKKLKKHFLRCFDKDNKEEYLNKTVIKFSLYKLSKDDEIKELLIENIEILKPFLESVLFYLDLHFPTDKDVVTLVRELLEKDIALYQHDKAIVFGKCNNLKYDENIYSANMSNESERFWIIRYQVIQWLIKNNEKQMLLTITNDMNNYYIERDLFIAKYELITDDKAKKQLIINELKNDNPMLALNAIAQVGWFTTHFYKTAQSEDYNDYIKNILNIPVSDYLMLKLKEEFDVAKRRSKPLVDVIKKDKEYYKECCDDLMKYVQTKDTIPETALENLDLFNSIITEMIIKNELGKEPTDDYGANISQIKTALPKCAFAFEKIHLNRNQKTAAHPKDKQKKFRCRITVLELKDLIKNINIGDAYLELSDYYAEKLKP